MCISKNKFQYLVVCLCEGKEWISMRVTVLREKRTQHRPSFTRESLQFVIFIATEKKKTGQINIFQTVFLFPSAFMNMTWLSIYRYFMSFR